MPNRRGSDRTDKTDTALTLLNHTLDGNVTIDGEPVRHFEHVEETASPPYYTSGPSDMTPGEVQTSSVYGGAQGVEVQLDSWSNYRGKKEVAELNRKALERLEAASLSLTGNDRLIRHSVLDARIVSEPEDSKMTFHGIITLAFRIQLPSV